MTDSQPAAAAFDPQALAQKLQRIASGQQPRVLDIFAGAGGISLGFQKAGFRIDGSVEFDPTAARTHATNFHRGHKLADIHARARDITLTEPTDLCRELQLGPTEQAIDILVGGPPCQAYARVGRAKLRDVADHPQAFKVDARGNLYLRYLAYVRSFQPLAVLIENVPDLLHYAHHNVAEEIVETLESYGYVAAYSLINAAFHGVPQMRDRVYLIAYRRELTDEVDFPAASNHMKLPPGYSGTRAVALRYVNKDAGYRDPDLGSVDLPFAVTAQEAIGDLPPIHGASVRRGARKFDTLAKYREGEPLPYARLMRSWPGFTAGDGVFDHVVRCLPRDGATFREMPPGAEYPEAFATALKIFERRAKRLRVQRGTQEFADLYRAIVPPYDVSKFPNKWWKLKPDFPVRTLMAHLGKDAYSHIHYDGAQERTVSVREAARLQSFPDGFRFEGAMNAAFRQIGNAVPPLMSFALAQKIRAVLRASAARLSAPAVMTKSEREAA